MNSHTPFNSCQPWWGNPSCGCGNTGCTSCNSSNDPLVDKLIGNAYHVVRTVYCNLGNLKLVFDFLNQYGMVLGVQSEAELKAMTVSASYVRLYGFDNTNKRIVTDYLYVEGDRTGVIPDDTTATGSWILVATVPAEGGGDNDGVASPYIIYTYNLGSALGGETTIPVPGGTVGVPIMVKNGETSVLGYGFTYDATGLTVNLDQALVVGDEVHLFLTGTPAVPNNPNISDWVQFNWLYNGGYAVGGEQVIAIPYTFQSVPAIYKNGDRYYPGLADKSYSIDAANQRILLTEALAANDRLIVTLGGESRVIIASDRTIQEVARSTNVTDNQVILSTNTTQYLNGMKIIYDEVAQKSYGLPTLPANVYINSVSNGQLTYSPGNVTVDLLPVPDPVQDNLNAFKADLANTADVAKGDALIGVKQPFTGSVARTQHSKNADVVSVTDFGAVADFNRDTNVGTDNTAAFQAAIDYCKVSHKALFVPSGWYLVSGNLTATYAIVMYGEGANGVAVTTSAQQDSPFIGSVIVGGNTTGYTLNVSPPNYQFGLSIRNVVFYGLPAQRSNVNHKALRLHNTGLQGYVENVAISGYGGSGLVIGYLQDTHIISLFIERCGTLDVAAIKFEARANYVYFQDCLMMACHYFVDNTDPVLFGRYIFWSGCHLEHGDYNGALGAEWDFYYNKTPFNIGAGSDWSFQNCIFIPVSNAGLAAGMGVSRLATPYFMVCSGERFNMVNCRFNAPRDSVSSLALTGVNSRTAMITDTIFQGADGGRPCIDAYYAEITNCTFNLDISAYTDRCSGVYVRRGGAVKGCKFRLGATTGSRRTLGHLILTDDDRYEAINVSGNTYPDTTYANAFVHRGCTISGEDGGIPRLVAISTTQTIDLSLYPTNVNFWVTAAVTITDILNGQYGRRLSVIANTAGVIINTSGNVYPKGNVNYTMTAGVPVEFRGMLDISANRKLFQLAG